MPRHLYYVVTPGLLPGLITFLFAEWISTVCFLFHWCLDSAVQRNTCVQSASAQVNPVDAPLGVVQPARVFAEPALPVGVARLARPWTPPQQTGRSFVRSFVLSSEFFVPMKRSVRIAVLDGMDGRTIFARTPFISTFYELFEKFFYFSSFHLKAWDAIISIKMNGSYRTELSSFSWDGCQIFYWLISKNHCVII